MKHLLRSMAMASMALGAACGGGGDDGGDPDAGVSALCMEATEHSDLEWIQDNVFTPSCAAFSSCHMGAARSAEGLNLESGMTEANVVNVDSAQVPGASLVAPGDPDGSYLLNKLGRGTFPAGADTTIMPFGNPPLCDEKIEAVARWVNSL